ncbi:MAG: hypothetical protein V1904_14505 [Bacteroidota bacterium]
MFVGILIGFLIAWSIVWWQGGSAGSWHFFKNFKHYISNLFDSKDKDEDVTIITEPGIKNNNSKIDPLLSAEMKNDSAYYDSTHFDFSNPDALDEFLAMYNGQLPDSSLFDSILKSQKNIDINNYNNAAEDVHVKKDKLIYAKSFTLPGIEYLFSDNTDKLDSLLSENSSSEKNNTNNILHVEFWKSPINYKGYKTGKNKLVLFGIEQFSMISFKILDKTLYMKYVSDYYQMDRTPEFKSLIPVSNSNLVSQLNNQ